MSKKALGFLAGVAALAAGCGGSSMSPSGGGGCPLTAGVAVSATGFAPKGVCISAGGTVTFSNTDSVAHDVEGLPTACTPLALGSIPASTARTTAVFSVPATCAYVDAGHSGDPAFIGTVTVGAGGGGGGGYP